MNILVVRFSSLGDLVTLEPTFRAIHYFYKNDKVTLLTSNIGKALFADSGYFDEFIIHKNVLNTIKYFGDKEYDIVINLQCHKPSHYATMFLKKGKVVNKSFNLFQKLFKIKPKVKDAQEILFSCGIESDKLNEYFIKDDGIISLPISKFEFSLKENAQKVVAISTGTSERWLSKKWGIERFSQLIGKLIHEDINVVLIGSSLELEDEAKILEKYSNVKSFVNKTNLTQLKNLLAEVDLFIGNDSGPTHIAAAVGTDTLTIFGSTDIKHCVKFMPYKGHHEYLKPSQEIKCHPCYKSRCPTKMECMESIKVDNVFSKVQEILKIQ